MAKKKIQDTQIDLGFGRGGRNQSFNDENRGNEQAKTTYDPGFGYKNSSPNTDTVIDFGFDKQHENPSKKTKSPKIEMISGGDPEVDPDANPYVKSSELNRRTDTVIIGLSMPPTRSTPKRQPIIQSDPYVASNELNEKPDTVDTEFEQITPPEKRRVRTRVYSSQYKKTAQHRSQYQVPQYQVASSSGWGGVRKTDPSGYNPSAVRVKPPVSAPRREEDLSRSNFNQVRANSSSSVRPVRANSFAPVHSSSVQRTTRVPRASSGADPSVGGTEASFSTVSNSRVRRAKRASSGSAHHSRVKRAPSGSAHHSRVKRAPSGSDPNSRVKRAPSGADPNSRVKRAPSGADPNSRAKRASSSAGSNSRAKRASSSAGSNSRGRKAPSVAGSNSRGRKAPGADSHLGGREAPGVKPDPRREGSLKIHRPINLDKPDTPFPQNNQNNQNADPYDQTRCPAPDPDIQSQNNQKDQNLVQVNIELDEIKSTGHHKLNDITEFAEANGVLYKDGIPVFHWFDNIPTIHVVERYKSIPNDVALWVDSASSKMMTTKINLKIKGNNLQSKIHKGKKDDEIVCIFESGGLLLKYIISLPSKKAGEELMVSNQFKIKRKLHQQNEIIYLPGIFVLNERGLLKKS